MRARARIDWDVTDQQDAIDQVAAWALHEGAEVTLMVEQEAATEVSSTVLAPVNVDPAVVDASGNVTVEPAVPAAVAPPTPIAAFSWTPSEPAVGDAVTFDASASTEASSPIATYDWVFGDGTDLPDGGVSVEHSYEASGSCGVELTVTDADNLTDTRTQALVVR